jgi:hypothetical protein
MLGMCPPLSSVNHYTQNSYYLRIRSTFYPLQKITPIDTGVSNFAYSISRPRENTRFYTFSTPDPPSNSPKYLVSNRYFPRSLLPNHTISTSPIAQGNQIQKLTLRSLLADSEQYVPQPLHSLPTSIAKSRLLLLLFRPRIDHRVFDVMVCARA